MLVIIGIQPSGKHPWVIPYIPQSPSYPAVSNFDDVFVEKKKE